MHGAVSHEEFSPKMPTAPPLKTSGALLVSVAEAMKKEGQGMRMRVDSACPWHLPPRPPLGLL